MGPTACLPPVFPGDAEPGSSFQTRCWSTVGGPGAGQTPSKMAPTSGFWVNSLLSVILHGGTRARMLALPVKWRGFPKKGPRWGQGCVGLSLRFSPPQGLFSENCLSSEEVLPQPNFLPSDWSLDAKLWPRYSLPLRPLPPKAPGFRHWSGRDCWGCLGPGPAAGCGAVRRGQACCWVVGRLTTQCLREAANRAN